LPERAFENLNTTMITSEKDDGIITIASSACCCPPGERRAGQHTNGGTQWWRINDEPWQRLHGISNALVLAGAAETCTEFREAMTAKPV
jgi:hypothetical protein